MCDHNERKNDDDDGNSLVFVAGATLNFCSCFFFIFQKGKTHILLLLHYWLYVPICIYLHSFTCSIFTGLASFSPSPFIHRVCSSFPYIFSYFFRDILLYKMNIVALLSMGTCTHDDNYDCHNLFGRGRVLQWQFTPNQKQLQLEMI